MERRKEGGKGKKGRKERRKGKRKKGRKERRKGKGSREKVNLEPFLYFSTKIVSALVEELWLDALILCYYLVPICMMFISGRTVHF